MKVKELIEKLKDFDQEMEVVIPFEDGCYMYPLGRIKEEKMFSDNCGNEYVDIDTKDIIMEEGHKKAYKEQKIIKVLSLKGR